NSRVIEKSATSEYGVFIELSMPQAMAKLPFAPIPGGVEGKPAAGAPGSSGVPPQAGPDGMVVKSTKRATQFVVCTPDGFSRFVVRPKDPSRSKLLTTPSPKWS